MTENAMTAARLDRLVGLLDLFDVPEQHRMNAKLSAVACPECEGIGRWRRGQEFEHEKICMKVESHVSGRNVVWCPGDILRYRDLLGQEMIGLQGSGI